MAVEQSAWKKYFNSRSKEIAIGSEEISPLDYGREVYASDKIFREEKSGLEFVRWVVTEFESEFNVFIERTTAGKKIRKNMIAFFKLKDQAIKFALRMLLISNGVLKRNTSLQEVASS